MIVPKYTMSSSALLICMLIIVPQTCFSQFNLDLGNQGDLLQNVNTQGFGLGDQAAPVQNVLQNFGPALGDTFQDNPLIASLFTPTPSMTPTTSPSPSTSASPTASSSPSSSAAASVTPSGSPSKSPPPAATVTPSRTPSPTPTEDSCARIPKKGVALGTEYGPLCFYADIPEGSKSYKVMATGTGSVQVKVSPDEQISTILCDEVIIDGEPSCAGATPDTSRLYVTTFGYDDTDVVLKVRFSEVAASPSPSPIPGKDECAPLPDSGIALGTEYGPLCFYAEIPEGSKSYSVRATGTGALQVKTSPDENQTILCDEVMIDGNPTCSGVAPSSSRLYMTTFGYDDTDVVLTASFSECMYLPEEGVALDSEYGPFCYVADIPVGSKSYNVEAPGTGSVQVKVSPDEGSTILCDEVIIDGEPSCAGATPNSPQLFMTTFGYDDTDVILKVTFSEVAASPSPSPIPGKDECFTLPADGIALGTEYGPLCFYAEIPESSTSYTVQAAGTGSLQVRVSAGEDGDILCDDVVTDGDPVCTGDVPSSARLYITTFGRDDTDVVLTVTFV